MAPDDLCLLLFMPMCNILPMGVDWPLDPASNEEGVAKVRGYHFQD